MQDFQPIPGLAGRIFASSGSDVARRGFPSSSTPRQQSPQAPTKCPRCDSANTKFCYYNNYNLSQPRHFCKSCRRYWTKGGILRNVPVGGGCRKNSKRSSKSSSSKPDSKSRRKAAESGSSSESSSTLTAPNLNPEPETDPNLVLEAPVFLGAAAGFGGLIGATDQAQGGFNFSDPGLLSGYPVGDPEQRRKAREGEAAVDLQVGKGVNGSGLDWGGSLFDIASSVDPSAYWNQNHWGDSDPSLFLP